MARSVDHLSDEILLNIFKYLSTYEKIINISLVCRRWNSLSNDKELWRCINLNSQRKVTGQAFLNLVSPITKAIILYECHEIKMDHIYAALKKTTKLEVLCCAWTEYLQDGRGSPINLSSFDVRNLTYLNVSHCKIDDNFFRSLPSGCPNLSILLMQDSKTISHTAYRSSNFKEHDSLKLLNISYSVEGNSTVNRNTLFQVLKYSHCNVLIDI